MTTLFHSGGTLIPNIFSQCIYKLWVVIINRASILAKFSFYCQNLSYNSSCAAYIQPYVEENHALIQSIQGLVPTSTALHPIAPNQEAHQRWPSSHRVCCSHGRSWRRRILSERRDSWCAWLSSAIPSWTDSGRRRRGVRMLLRKLFNSPLWCMRF